MNVLSIQSAVVVGHVGNSAARFALERLGHEVWPIDTVSLAFHPGHGRWCGRMAEPAELATLIDGLDEAGALARCDAVLSGYLGDAALGAPLLDAVARVKARRAEALYACDPVMGSGAKGFYVRDGIPAFFRDRALPRADILLPNAFELGWLTGREIDGIAAAHEAARSLLSRGPRLVVVKGLARRLGGKPRIGALAVTAKAAWHVEAPLVDAPADGAGDAFAALFLGHYLKRRGVPQALERAASGIHAVMTKTAALGGSELALIESQDALARPKRLFKAGRIG